MAANLFMNRRIEQFMTVYESGTIHAAAEALGISQPALSVSLKNLEDELAIKLFDRSVKGMNSTIAGETLYRFGATLRQGGRFAIDEMRRLTEGVFGGLRIGTGVAWATTVLPGALNELHSAYPELSIDLVTGVGDQLVTRMISGELDVMIAAGSVQRLATPEFHGNALTKLPMKVVADPNSKLAQEQLVSPQQLSSVPWVGFYEDDSMVRFSNHFLALHGLPPAKFAMRTNSPTSLASFIKGTEFVAVLIAPLAKSVTKNGLVELPTTMPLWDLPVSIYHQSIATSLPIIMTFNDLVGAAMREFSEKHD